MIKSPFLCAVFAFLGCSATMAQVVTEAGALFSPGTKTISVRQTIQYTNPSTDTLQAIYLNDWANAFKQKTSPLGQHFNSEYIKQFHFSSLSERGQTKLDNLRKTSGISMLWQRLPDHPDIIKVDLKKPLAPKASVNLQLRYSVRIPEDKFTGYGYADNGDYNIRYWLISPAVYENGAWQIYSHQDLNDQYQPAATVDITLKLPNEYTVKTDLSKQSLTSDGFFKTVKLSGVQRMTYKMALVKDRSYDNFETPYGEIITNIADEDVPKENRAITTKRIMSFLNKRLGDYPHHKLFISEADYKNSPIYGLNQLPGFIRPFPDGFQYDLKMMKTITHHYLRNTLKLNPRKEEWLFNAIQISLLMDYVSNYYPDIKWIGKLSDVIGIRWAHLADLDFNDQYDFFFRNMNRMNLDQPAGMSKDSLVKFNAEIANPYKAGLGFKYLDDFLGGDVITQTIAGFYQDYALKPVRASDFEHLLKTNTSRDVDWFFKEYINSNSRLDFTIKNVEQRGDSLEVTVKNKENNSMPVSLSGLNDDEEEVAKYWIEHTRGLTKITIPKGNIRRLALNNEGTIPEINRRNNYKNIKGLFNKPLQFRLLKDVEDPHYSQFFVLPQFTYNLYDGFIIGPRVSNKAVLPKRFTYKISPQYGFRSHSLLGKFSFSNTHQFRNRNLSDLTYGLSAHRYSYAEDLYYRRFSPFITLKWRHRDLRNRERQYLSFRNVNVHRDKSSLTDATDEPDYNVFDLEYTYSNKNLINTFRGSLDYQIAKKFSKVSITAKYRKLFLNNRQLEFRLFSGAFIYNHTDADSDYFSFALDRPSDYLFDYNYYGRSESSGLFSQQFIESEGGFKSKLKPAFADRWITTLNTSVSLWRDIVYAYGDFGMIKNSGDPLKLRHDSGLRLSLVQDYFELFFPVYSNNGWEMAKSHYNHRIRFIVTLDFHTLMGLFSRTYY